MIKDNLAVIVVKTNSVELIPTVGFSPDHVPDIIAKLEQLVLRMKITHQVYCSREDDE